MTEKEESLTIPVTYPEFCEHGKRYPCCDCSEPCAEELKRREFYENLPEPTEDEIAEWE